MLTYTRFTPVLVKKLSELIFNRQPTYVYLHQEVLSGSSLLRCLSDSCVVVTAHTAAPQSTADNQDGR